jgi:thymidylate kinase
MAMGAFESISSASPTALHHLGKGKVESFWVAGFGDVVTGAEAAARSLALTPAEKKIEKDRAALRFVDDRGDSVALWVERRTARVTSVLIDVGFTGSMAFAKLVARQIVVELIEAGVFPDDAEPDAEEGQGFKNL